MEVRRFLSIAAATAVVGTAVLMTGCGSDDSSSASAAGSTSSSGLLGFWKGVKYTSNGTKSGVTGDGGALKYDPDANMTFEVVGKTFTIGNATMASNLTVVNFHDQMDTDFGNTNSSTQLTMFLATLGNGGNATLANATELDTTFNVGTYDVYAQQILTNQSVNLSSATALSNYFVDFATNTSKKTAAFSKAKELIGSSFDNATAVSTFNTAALDSYTAAVNENIAKAAADEKVDGFDDASVNHTIASVAGYEGTPNENRSYNLTGATITGAKAKLSGNDFFILSQKSYKEGMRAEHLNSTYGNRSNYVISAVTYDLSNLSWSANTNKTLTFGDNTITFNKSGGGNNGTFNSSITGFDGGNWTYSSDNQVINLIHNSTVNKSVAFTRAPSVTGFYAYIWNEIQTGIGSISGTPFYNATQTGMNVTTAGSTTWN